MPNSRGETRMQNARAVRVKHRSRDCAIVDHVIVSERKHLVLYLHVDSILKAYAEQIPQHPQRGGILFLSMMKYIASGYLQNLTNMIRSILIHNSRTAAFFNSFRRIRDDTTHFLLTSCLM